MVCRIAFMRYPAPDRRVAGRYISTRELVRGLNDIGVQAFYSRDSDVKADYYAVDCLDEIKWLPKADPAQRIAWIRRDVYRLTARPAIDGVGHLFASSQFVANAWTQYPVTVLPDPVYVPRWIRPHLRSGVLYVGRVCRSKGIPLLLQAMKFLNPRWRLTIAGPMVEDFGPMVENYNLARQVKFTGELRQWQVGRLYRQAECVVVPSQFEPFGRAIVEAWANGCTPIAIAGSGGPQEIMGEMGRYPYLIDHNPMRLAGAIREVTDNGRRLSYGHCRQLAQPYNRRIIAQRFMEALNGNPTHHQPGAEQPTTTPRGPAG